MDWRAAIFKGHPIEESALGGANNFNLLRLFAAALVLYSHSFHLLDRRHEEPIGAWFGWFDASVLGVSIFFFISGFLVCRSWDTRRDPVSFLTARVLRIAPAYWCVLLVVALVLGPAVTYAFTERLLARTRHLEICRVWRRDSCAVPVARCFRARANSRRQRLVVDHPAGSGPVPDAGHRRIARALGGRSRRRMASAGGLVRWCASCFFSSGFFCWSGSRLPDPATTT